MNSPIHFQQLEEKIKRACLDLMAEGWTIQDGLYLRDDKRCCCPLTALALKEGTVQETDLITGKVLSDALMLDRNYVRDFTAGFDADRGHLYSLDYFQLGSRLRDWWQNLS